MSRLSLHLCQGKVESVQQKKIVCSTVRVWHEMIEQGWKREAQNSFPVLQSEPEKAFCLKADVSFKVWFGIIPLPPAFRSSVFSLPWLLFRFLITLLNLVNT